MVMVYLDYSATTPTNKKVLETFLEVSKKYYGNPNSLHKLGSEANDIINASTKQISQLLNVKSSEIIYTSGSSEANNLAVKGIADKYNNRGKHIITTKLEHSSIVAPLSYLQKKGYLIDFLVLNESGTINLNHLESLINEETILVTICAVDSELGIRQPIEKIGRLLKKYPKVIFHVDATQCLGKDYLDLTDVDLASISAHKIFGIKGIGALIKKDHLILEPIIHGGKSTTIFRSGTPATSMIVSFAKAIRLALDNLELKKDHVEKLNKNLRDYFKQYENIVINSTEKSIPNILNFSVKGIKPETLQHALERYEIYISTKSACSSENNVSTSVMALTNNQELALSSLRISIADITTEEEINYFKDKFALAYKSLEEII